MYVKDKREKVRGMSHFYISRYQGKREGLMFNSKADSSPKVELSARITCTASDYCNSILHRLSYAVRNGSEAF